MRSGLRAPCVSSTAPNLLGDVRVARPIGRGRRASSTTPPAATSGCRPASIASSIACRQDLECSRGAALAPDLVGEVHVRRNRRCGMRSSIASDERELQVLDPVEVAELAAHEAPPLVRANELTSEPELLAERIAFSAHSSPSSGRPARSCSRVTPCVRRCRRAPARAEAASRSSSARSRAPRMRLDAAELEVRRSRAGRRRDARCACRAGWPRARCAAASAMVARFLEPPERLRLSRRASGASGRAPPSPRGRSSRALAVARRRRVDVELERPIPREHEEPRRSELRAPGLASHRLPRQRERLGRVMSEQLGVVGDAVAGHPLDPVAQRRCAWRHARRAGSGRTRRRG